MNEKPNVSIIMSVYNGEEYIDEAIKSVLNQTYIDFEFIIINDGSSDKSLSIINKYKAKDSRIFLISRENRGLVASLNEGIDNSKGKYIARMDADDLCRIDRIEKQVSFLDENPDFGFVSSRAKAIDQEGRYIRDINTPKHNIILKSILFFGNPIIHPSVMFNKELINKSLYYSDEFLHAEDYELWARLSLDSKIKFYCIPEYLLSYRIVQTSISRRNYIEQENASIAIKNKYFIKKGRKRSIDTNLDLLLSIFLDQDNKKYLLPQSLYWIRNIFKSF